MKKQNLDWLQALRGIAALMVVVCHARTVFHGTPYELVSGRLMAPGACGVDLFFMISGFIMVYTTTDANGTFAYMKKFFAKRFSRVWPVYVAAIFLNLVLPTNRLALLANHEYAAGVAKSVFFLPVTSVFAPFFAYPYDIGWTLNFEVYFYIIFGISTLFSRHRWTVLTTWLAFTLIAIPLMKAGHTGLNVRDNYGFTSPYFAQMTNPIIWEFLLGVAIGKIYLSGFQFRSAFVANALMIACTVFSIWFIFSWQRTFNGLDQWGAPLPFMFLAIALGCKSVELRVPKIWVWLGGISYSLYLFHPIAKDIYLSIMLATGHEKQISTWESAVALVLFAIPVAALSHRILERGISDRLKKALLRRLSRPTRGQLLSN